MPGYQSHVTPDFKPIDLVGAAEAGERSGMVVLNARRQASEFASSLDLKQQELGMKQQEMGINASLSQQRMDLEKEKLKLEASESITRIEELHHKMQHEDAINPIRIAEAQLNVQKLQKDKEVSDILQSPQELQSIMDESHAQKAAATEDRKYHSQLLQEQDQALLTKE